MSRSWRHLVAGLVAAVGLWGCSGDENTLTQAGGSSEEAGGAGEARAEDFHLEDPELEAGLRSFYDEFLVAWDLHLTPDESVAEPGSGLAELAAPEVVAAAEAWRAANEAHGEGFQRVVSLHSVANVTGLEVDGPRATIEDCTERTSVMTTGQEITEYVSQVVEVANEGGPYRVVDLEVLHEGRIDSPGYGCVPEPMATEAVATIEALWSGVRAAQGDPRAGLAPEVLALAADPLETELVSALAEQADRGLSYTSPTELEVTVLGTDPRGLGLVVVTEMCVSHPEGLEERELAGGEVVRQVFPPGTGQTSQMAVRMNGAEGPEVYEFIPGAVSPSC